MIKYIEFHQRNDSRGTMISVRREKSAAATSIYISDKILGSEALGPSMKIFLNSLTNFVNTAPIIAEGLSEIGWQANAHKETAGFVKAGRELQKAASMRKKENDKRREDLLKPEKPIDPLKASEIRQWAQTKKPAEILRCCLADADIATAVLDFKAILGIPDELIIHIENSLIEHNIQSKYAAQMTKKPNLDDILASGPDKDGAKKIAAEAIKRFEESIAEVNEAKDILYKTVDFYSEVVGASRHTAFESFMQ